MNLLHKSEIQILVLDKLLFAYPMELRFSELWEMCEKPSKSRFTKALEDLRADNLVTRTEVGRHLVTYVLCLNEYRSALKETGDAMEAQLAHLSNKLDILNSAKGKEYMVKSPKESTTGR